MNLQSFFFLGYSFFTAPSWVRAGTVAACRGSAAVDRLPDTRDSDALNI